jgi:hypothetical protein
VVKLTHPRERRTRPSRGLVDSRTPFASVERAVRGNSTSSGSRNAAADLISQYTKIFKSTGVNLLMHSQLKLRVIKA